MLDEYDNPMRGLPHLGWTGCLLFLAAIVLSWLMVAGIVWVIEKVVEAIL
jgi:hypothetical protein